MYKLKCSAVSFLLLWRGDERLQFLFDLSCVDIGVSKHLFGGIFRDVRVRVLYGKDAL